VAAERVEGPTPAGGAYAVAVFMDEDGAEVGKAEATRVKVVEYDSSGARLAETHAVLSPRRSG